MWFVLAFLFVLQSVYCMRDAEETEWNRYGYLVKVLSQSPVNESRVIGCTGTLITPSLILTSSKCIATDEDGEAGNTAMSIYSEKDQRNRKRAVSSITQIDRIAVLEIIAIRDKMCPPPPAPARLSKLSMNVTLTSIPWQPVDLEVLPEKKCRINGFKTTEAQSKRTPVHSVSDFSTEHETMQAEVQVVKDDGGIVVEDDIGLPLECMLDGETWTQVGFLESVTKVNLRFLMFDSNELAKMLDEHAIDVLLAAKKCFSRDAPRSSMTQ
ncbi:hypothetical protein COOONC_17271 [Cooperia oncophora]